MAQTATEHLPALSDAFSLEVDEEPTLPRTSSSGRLLRGPQLKELEQLHLAFRATREAWLELFEAVTEPA